MFELLAALIENSFSSQIYICDVKLQGQPHNVTNFEVHMGYIRTDYSLPNKLDNGNIPEGKSQGAKP